VASGDERNNFLRQVRDRIEKKPVFIGCIDDILNQPEVEFRHHLL